MSETVSPAILAKVNQTDVIADWRTGNDEVRAKEIGDILTQHYPNYLWMVFVNMHEGLVEIACGHLGANRVFRIKMNGQGSAEARRKEIIRAGGEILERFNQPRTGFDPDHYNALERDVRGMPKGDFS